MAYQVWMQTFKNHIYLLISTFTYTYRLRESVPHTPFAMKVLENLAYWHRNKPRK